MIDLKFPIYLPDATRAVVKSLDSQDLRKIKIEAVVVNTLHLAENPGLESLEKLGGVKRLMNFGGVVVSDSGGWQVFSLIHRGKTKGKITDERVVFSIGTAKKQLFTPEESIKTQLKIGSDILICLDDFTPPDSTYETAEKTVERTIAWAKRCKTEFDSQTTTSAKKPLLFAVIQGGWFKDLRKYCTQELIKIGFDGYGYGGYAINPKNNELDLELSDYIVKLIPEKKLKFALGVGRPIDIANLWYMGWQIFDCTLPTRDARHMRLYKFAYEPRDKEDLLNKALYEFVYINQSKYKEDTDPLDSLCDCETCESHSKAYLYHLFKIGDFSAYRLATIHNLRHYTRLIEYIRNIDAF